MAADVRGRGHLLLPRSHAVIVKKTGRSTRRHTRRGDSCLDALFDTARPIPRETFEELLRAVAPFGPVRIEAEHSSIRLHAGSAVHAFAVLKPGKIGIVVRLRSLAPMASLRVLRAERVSADRVDNAVLVTHKRAVDDELTRWLRTAYRLSAVPG